MTRPRYAPCADCGLPREPGHLYCETCLGKRTRRKRERRHALAGTMTRAEAERIIAEIRARRAGA
jgi:hypothetical protein